MNSWIVSQVADLLSGNITVVKDVHAYTGNSKAITWKVKAMNGSEAADLNGAKCTVYVIREDQVTVVVEGTISGNLCEAVFKKECFAVPGVVKCLMNLTDASETEFTVSAFEFVNGNGPTDKLVDPGKVLDINAVIEAAKGAVRFDIEQQLTEVQKETARKNLDVGGVYVKQGSLVLAELKADRGITAVTVLEPQQQGSGNPSPSNIRTIVGYDALNLNASGKNLLNNIRYYDSTHTDIRAQYDAPLLLKAGVTYTLSTNIKADGLFFVDAVGGGALEAQYLLKYEYQVASLSYTPTADVRCIFVAIFNSGVPDGTTIQLEVGSATAHEPYQGNNYTVQIGQTVYGGKMDWLTGKLFAEWGLYTLTGEGGAKLTSASVHNAKCFMTDVIPGAKGNSDLLSGAKSSHFVEEIWNNIVRLDSPFGKFGINTSNKIGIGYDGTIDEANAWLAAQYAAGTPVQIAYKLATPIEIDLSAQAAGVIEAVEGINTVYGDGDLEVTCNHDRLLVEIWKKISGNG